MIYRETGTCGGIQRGASFQVGQFAEWGYEPVVLTEADLGDGPRRRETLEAVLRERRADFVIEHDAYSERKLSADIAAARAAGVPIAVFWHSVFSWMVANGNPHVQAIMALLRRADAIITLSRCDETFFRMMGCRAVSIPYCDADLMEGFVRTEYPRRVLWMGRFVDLKRPLDALRIAERLRGMVPDVELVMLGDGDAGRRGALAKYVDERPALRSAVRFEGFRKDVRPYLKEAGAGLVTSMVEGFCHAIVEMKMASLPVVAYSMPYLETLADGQGSFQVPQGDIEAAAEKLAELFLSRDECLRQGRLSRGSYERLRTFDQKGAYARLFADVSLPCAESSLLDVGERGGRASVEVLDVLLGHCVAGFGTVKSRTECRYLDGAPGPGLREAAWRFALSCDAAVRRLLRIKSRPRFARLREQAALKRLRGARFAGPRVSVIIPVYNVETYLRRCLDSLLGQTLRDIEIICVDDGSTDGSPGILDFYASDDARVKVVRQENAGAGAARNRGMDLAAGEYLFFCDPDDFCDRRMLHDMYLRAKAKDADIVVAGKTVVDAETGETIVEKPLSAGMVWGMRQPFPPERIAGRIFSFAKSVAWDKLFRRGFVVSRGLRFQALPRSNDVFFTDMALATARRIALVRKGYYRYSYRRDGSLTFAKARHPFAAFEAYRAVEEALREKGLFGLYGRNFTEVFVPIMLANLKAVRAPDVFARLYGMVRGRLLELSRECPPSPEMNVSQRVLRQWKGILEDASPEALRRELGDTAFAAAAPAEVPWAN